MRLSRYTKRKYALWFLVGFAVGAFVMLTALSPRFWPGNFVCITQGSASHCWRAS